MTDHYTEAERLLEGAQNVMEVAPVDGLTNRECAFLAHTHALLAVADLLRERLPGADGLHHPDYSYRCPECGWSTADSRYEQHVCSVEERKEHPHGT